MSSDYPLPPNPDEAITAVPPPALADLPEVEPAAARGHAAIAWAVILGVVSLSVAAGMIRDPSEKVGGSRQGTQARLLDVESRYFVGASDQLARLTGQDLFAQQKHVDPGDDTKRLRFAVVAGELAGPNEALNRLGSRDFADLPPDLQPVRGILQRLYGDYEHDRWAAPSVTSAERDTLTRELGWLGKLALNPANGSDAAARAALLFAARKTFWAMLTLTLGILGLGLAGLAGLFVFLRFARMGVVRSGLGPSGVNGAIYAETFAAWLLLFLLLSLVGLVLPIPKEARFLALGIASLLGLLALGWPVLRGIPWAQVKQEIGLQRPARPAREVLLGPAVYACTLPLLAVGVVLTLVIVQVQSKLLGSDAAPPAHPIAEVLAKAPWWELIQALVLISVIAPLVEETMFRGVLYRHLREASVRWRPVVGMMSSMLLTSFIFAVIHPQGVAAVPALMALAFGFNMAREWRGTLLPSMIAHGLNNAVVFVLAVFVLGD